MATVGRGMCSSAIRTDDIAMAFNLKHLLVVVLVIAVGLTGLLNPHRDFFQNLMGIVTIAILIYFAYSIWITKGATRAFCIGFVLWCALYFIDYTRNFLGIDLGIRDMLHPLYLWLNPDQTSGQGVYDNFAPSRFHYVGHCLFALLLGLIGGWVTVYFYRKRQRTLEPRS
jgi:hypothetical protein